MANRTVSGLKFVGDVMIFFESIEIPVLGLDVLNEGRRSHLDDIFMDSDANPGIGLILTSQSFRACGEYIDGQGEFRCSRQIKRAVDAWV